MGYHTNDLVYRQNKNKKKNSFEVWQKGITNMIKGQQKDTCQNWSSKGSHKNRKRRLPTEYHFCTLTVFRSVEGLSLTRES